MVCYFDSSILLAILLDQKRREEALTLWTQAPLRVSSLLLTLETLTVLRRTYEHNKKTLNSSWLTKKTAALNEFLQEINIRTIDEDIEHIIRLKKEISKCRTLDAIHIATAIEFSKLTVQSDFFLYTFDLEMAGLARRFKFNVNVSEEENYM